jgi:cell division protein FtsI (penicillin-binding protein 3)
VNDLTDIHRQQSARVGAWSRALVLVTLLGTAGIFGRVAQLKLAPDERLASAVGRTISSHREIARRGDLLDSRGRVIATSTVGYRLFVDPLAVSDLQTISLDLGRLTGMRPDQIDRLIAERPDSRYVVIADHLPDGRVEAVRQARLRGVGLEPRLVRQYSHRESAALLVGRVGFEHTGQSGFEHVFDPLLRQTDGRLSYLRDVARQALWIQPSGYAPAADGKTVQISIDLVIQEIADRALRAAVKSLNAGGGRVVVADPQTGEILALCDILNPRPGWDEATSDPNRALDPALGRNRCVTDPYEPGSTFKSFIWAVATELGKAHPDELLPTPEHTGWRSSRGRLIREAFYYGPSTWRTVLIKSINSGMAMVAERMTESQMQDAIRRFGFGAKTSCGLPGESPGIVTPPSKWTSYSQLSVSFGQEVSVTPVQMVRAFSAFARDGTLAPLRITAAGAASGDLNAGPRALDPAVAWLTRHVMRDVMLQGSGRAAQSQKYQMFGKSGTAQLPKKDGRGYFEDRYVSSFIAGAPFENPRIVVLCIIDDPDKRIGHLGGSIAGPVVRNIIDETLGYLGVTPDLSQDQTTLASR